MSRRALGWDIHRKFSKVSVRELDDDGELGVVERRRLEHADREAMIGWLHTQPPGTPVAMEAAFGWPWIADLLEEEGFEPHLAHPPATRVLAKHHAKTDRCDADRLGEFFLQGILPESYLAPGEVRSRRDRIRYRMALSRLRTGVKNRIQAVLHRQGVLHDYSDLFGKAGRAFLDDVALPEASRVVVDGYLELLANIHRQIDEVEQWMRDVLPRDETVRLLMTLPGVGLILAHVLVAEIGQIERFPSFRHLASYAGLAPVANDSADRHGRRRISAACNRTLRWALVEAANVLARCGATKAPRLASLYQRLSHGGRANKNQAKVAVAHALVKLVYVIWTRRQPYTPTPPARPGASEVSDKKQNRKPRKKNAPKCPRSDQPRYPMVRQASTDAG